MSKKLLRTAVAGGLLGVSLYVGSDVLGEYTTYVSLRDKGLAFAAQDAQLGAQIGVPFEVGAWYNASIGFTQSGHIAAITFPLKGSSQITDVTVRAVRRPGVPSAALYNLLGGEWKVLDCSAMAPQPGGLVRPRSIMPVQAVPKVADGKVVPGEECEECNRKAAGAGTETAGSGAAAEVVSGRQPSLGAGLGAGSEPGLAQRPGALDAAAAESGTDAQTGVQKKRRRFWLF